jgi:hypothetical protein
MAVSFENIGEIVGYIKKMCLLFAEALHFYNQQLLYK